MPWVVKYKENLCSFGGLTKYARCIQGGFEIRRFLARERRDRDDLLSPQSFHRLERLDRLERAAS